MSVVVVVVCPGESIVVDAWTGTSFLEITDDEVRKREREREHDCQPASTRRVGSTAISAMRQKQFYVHEMPP